MSEPTGRQPGHNASPKGFVTSPPVKVTVPKSSTLPVNKVDTTEEGRLEQLQENGYILKLIKAEFLPELLIASFPNGVDKVEMAKIYEQVAKSIVKKNILPTDKYAVHEVIRDILPSWSDSQTIRGTYNSLGLDNSRQIEDIVDDAGEALNGMDEIKLAWITASYTWAFDALVEYLGGYKWYSSNRQWLEHDAPAPDTKYGRAYATKSEYHKERYGWK